MNFINTEEFPYNAQREWKDKLHPGRDSLPPGVCNRPIQSGRISTKLKINFKKGKYLEQGLPKRAVDRSNKLTMVADTRKVLSPCVWEDTMQTTWDSTIVHTTQGCPSEVRQS